jgi:hypothetical protein
MRGLVRVRLRRSRCAGRGSLHAPRPAFLLLRWADLAEVIGAALAARALQQGARPIAAVSGRGGVRGRRPGLYSVVAVGGQGTGCCPVLWLGPKEPLCPVTVSGGWGGSPVAVPERWSAAGPCGGAPKPRLHERPSCGQCPAGEGGLCRRPRAGGRGAGAVVTGGRGRKDWSRTVAAGGPPSAADSTAARPPGPQAISSRKTMCAQACTLNRRVLPATLDSSLRRIPRSGTNQDSRAKTRRITVLRGG